MTAGKYGEFVGEDPCWFALVVGWDSSNASGHVLWWLNAATAFSFTADPRGGHARLSSGAGLKIPTSHIGRRLGGARTCVCACVVQAPPCCASADCNHALNVAKLRGGVPHTCAPFSAAAADTEALLVAASADATTLWVSNSHCTPALLCKVTAQRQAFDMKCELAQIDVSSEGEACSCAACTLVCAPRCQCHALHTQGRRSGTSSLFSRHLAHLNFLLPAAEFQVDKLMTPPEGDLVLLWDSTVSALVLFAPPAGSGVGDKGTWRVVNQGKASQSPAAPAALCGDGHCWLLECWGVAPRNWSRRQ